MQTQPLIRYHVVFSRTRTAMETLIDIRDVNLENVKNLYAIIHDIEAYISIGFVFTLALLFAVIFNGKIYAYIFIVFIFISQIGIFIPVNHEMKYIRNRP